MFNFAKIRHKERLQSHQTTQKVPTKAAVETSPLATKIKEAAVSASKLVPPKLATNAKPAATASELEIVHRTHWKINEICHQVADRLTAVSNLCAAERPDALKKISQNAIRQLNKLGSGTSFPQEILVVLEQAIATGEPQGFLKAMLPVVRHAAGLRPHEGATADTGDAIGRLLLQASILAEAQALRANPSLNRSQAIDRVALQVRAFAQKVRASVDLRIRIDADYRALEHAKQGSRDQTLILLHTMAGTLSADSLPG